MDSQPVIEIGFIMELSSVPIAMKADVIRLSETKFHIPTIKIISDDKLSFLEDIYIEKKKLEDSYSWVHSVNEKESELCFEIGNAIDLCIELFNVD
jgi:hypothetical protein